MIHHIVLDFSMFYYLQKNHDDLGKYCRLFLTTVNGLKIKPRWKNNNFISDKEYTLKFRIVASRKFESI